MSESPSHSLYSLHTDKVGLVGAVHAGGSGLIGQLPPSIQTSSAGSKYL